MSISPEKEIKEFGFKLGVPLVGIASVREINRFAPEGHRPDDFLIGAKSVVVLVDRWGPRGTWRSPDHRLHQMNRSFAVPRRNTVALAMANFIEEQYGYYSINYGGVELSHKLCADMAGLGTRSMAAGIILNKELGPLHIAPTITTMPLRADGPLQEPICPHPSCVKRWERDRTTPCLETCPECLSGELESGRIKWMRYKRYLCATRAQTTSINSFQRTLLEAINEPDLEKRKTIIMGSFFADIMNSIASGSFMGQCGECLRGCPVVLRTRTLRPKRVM